MIPVRLLISESSDCLCNVWVTSIAVKGLLWSCFRYPCLGISCHINAGLCFSGLTVLGYSPKTGMP